MTQNQIIGILMLFMLVMAFVIWCQDRLLDKEKKNYEDLLAIHNETLKEIERKYRLLAAWEKSVADSSYLEQIQTLPSVAKAVYMTGEWGSTSHPCVGCNTGWGSANSEEVHTCEETCEKLAAWNEQQKKGSDHAFRTEEEIRASLSPEARDLYDKVLADLRKNEEG